MREETLSVIPTSDEKMNKEIRLYMEHLFISFQQFCGSHIENLMYFFLYFESQVLFLFQCILYISAFLLYGVIGMNECQVHFLSSCQK